MLCIGNMAGHELLVAARVIDRELQNGRRYGAIKRAGKGVVRSVAGVDITWQGR